MYVEKCMVSLIFHLSHLKFLRMILNNEFSGGKTSCSFLGCFKYLNGTCLILSSMTGNLGSTFLMIKSGWEMEVYMHPENFIS